MKYAYPAEKLSIARRCLMVPHTRGEAKSVAEAFHNCSLGLHDIKREDLDDNARDLLKTLDGYMSTEGLVAPDGKGLWQVRAEELSSDDKLDLSRVIDELAHWFARSNWTSE